MSFLTQTALFDLLELNNFLDLVDKVDAVAVKLDLAVIVGSLHDEGRLTNRGDAIHRHGLRQEEPSHRGRHRKTEKGSTK